MRGTTLGGVLLIVLGTVALSYRGITYTSREKIVNVGPIEASRETEKTIPLPPILGGIALVSGIALLLAGTRQG